MMVERAACSDGGWGKPPFKVPVEDLLRDHYAGCTNPEVKLCAELRRLLFDDTRPHEEMVELVRRMTGVTGCVVRGLTEAEAAENWMDFGRYLWAAYLHPSRAMTPVLVKVLRRKDETAPTEQAVDLLIDLEDPASFDALADILWWHPEFDEFHAIPVKAVYALANLPGSEPVLRDVAALGPDEVKFIAETVLANGVA